MRIPDMRTCQADAAVSALGTRDIGLNGAIGSDNYSRSMAVEYDPMRDHYVALGVGSMASDEIKKAQLAFIRQLHPSESSRDPCAGATGAMRAVGPSRFLR